MLVRTAHALETKGWGFNPWKLLLCLQDQNFPKNPRIHISYSTKLYFNFKASFFAHRCF